MITIYINNFKIFSKRDITILEACKIAHVEIPRFCYHERLSVAGNCRMCLVEVKNSPKPVVACTTPVVNGMNIFTNTPLVKKARESVLEILLMNHPLDCPVCDQSGECDLQDQSRTFGSDRSRFYDFKVSTEDKNLGNIIKTVMTRCIHCTRCVRFAQEIAGVGTLGTLVRGSSTQIGTYLEKVFQSELSGNLVDLCPVGALSSKLLTATEKSWELDKLNTIDISDGIGSNIRMDFKKNKLVRILPRLNTNINEEWISDKARFYYDGLIDVIESPSIQRSENFFYGFRNSNLLTYRAVKNFSIRFNTETNWLINKNYTEQSSPILFLNIKYSYNLIGRIFKIVSSKNIIALCGAQTAVDTQVSMIDFINKLGSNKVGFERNLKVNLDFSSNFTFNSTINGLSDTDLCLFVGVNPKFEGSAVNLRLRKRYLKGGVEFMSIGAISNVTYPIKHLGLGVKTLLQIVEGKHTVCKNLKKSKNPTIIFSSSLLEREDSLGIYNILNSINKNVSVIDLNCLNLLHSDANQFGALELGLTKVNQRLIHNAEILYCVEINKNVINNIFEYKNPTTNNFSFLTYKNQKISNNSIRNSFNRVMIYNHFTGPKLYSPDIILPTFYLEQSMSKYYINTEGRPQRSSLSLNSDSKSTNSIYTKSDNSSHFSFLTEIIFDGTNSNVTALISKNRILKLIPSISTTYKIKNRSINISSNTVLKNKKLFKTNFNTLINNFYDANVVSKTMQLNALEFYSSSTNFTKFYGKTV